MLYSKRISSDASGYEIFEVFDQQQQILAIALITPDRKQCFLSGTADKALESLAVLKRSNPQNQPEHAAAVFAAELNGREYIISIPPRELSSNFQDVISPPKSPDYDAVVGSPNFPDVIVLNPPSFPDG